MSRKLTDISLYTNYSAEEEKRIFSGVNRKVISDLYVLYLDGFKPKGTSRISVTLGYDNWYDFYFGSILSVRTKFDKDEFLEKDKTGKQKHILDTVHRIALFCAEKYNWETTSFEKAYQRVLDSKFIYIAEGKRKLSKDKKHKASILLEKNDEFAAISTRFYDKEGYIVRQVELLKSFNDEMFYGGIIKNNKWFTNTEFGISNSSGELVIKASLEEIKAEVVINPGRTDKEELEELPTEK